MSDLSSGSSEACASGSSGEISEGGDEDDEDSQSEDAYKSELSKLRRWGLRPPIWSDKVPWCEVDKHQDLLAVLAQLQGILTEHLKRDNYNTFGNLLHFYNEFCAHRNDVSLEEFYRQYDAPVVLKGLSCVGLSFRMRDCIIDRLPLLERSVVLASCEEWVENLNDYVTQPDPGIDTVKEHVMLAVRIYCRETNQKSLVILDSGYHVPKTIVVTSDGAAPHTGRFLQSDTPKSRKEYEFIWKNDAYVQWSITETRKGHTSTWNNLIYTAGNYESSLGYSEKRNLLYDFRTIVGRDENGPCAGIYVKLNEANWNAHFTLFYKDANNHRIESKYPVSSVAHGVQDPCTREVAKRLQMSEDKLLIALEDTAKMYEDRQFIRELLRINYAVDPFEQARPVVD